MAETEFRTTFTDRPVGRIALVTIDDGEDHRRPTMFSGASLDSLDRALDDLEAQDGLVGVVVTGKPWFFAAGADLTMFVGMDAERARAAARRGHEVFARLAALPVPTLAAINGVCMGGGLELALHCDVRTVSSGARAVAFPEVFLSIFPAWGGTQLAPRVIGARHAVEVIVERALDNSRVLRPDEVLERGLADRLYDAAGFLDDSVALLERIVAGDEVITRDVDPLSGLDDALARGRQAADERTHGSTDAPYVALDLIEFAARGGDLAEGRRREQEALADLLPARQAQASVYAFDLVNSRVKKQMARPDVPARVVSRVAIVGAGLMGAQLGALHLQRLQVPVVMVDLDEDVLAECRRHVDEQLDRQVVRGRLTDGRARFLKGLLTTTSSMDEAQGADWVMEAVSEDLEVKRAILARLEEVLDDHAVIATNTSSLSVGAMARTMQYPSRLVGLHFFNPVAVLPLVEVVRHATSSDEAVSTAFEVARQLGKSAVACADATGFVVNRLLIRFHAAAAGALRSGTSHRAVDDAVKALGMPMGPFELFGLVGLEVVHRVARMLEASFGERFAVDENFEVLGASGLPGVYDWLSGGDVHASLQERLVIDEQATPWSADRIQQVALDAVADEIGRMLDEAVVADPRDIDTALLLGAGWPFHNGGVCPLLDDGGVSMRVLGRSLLTTNE
ncbi:MAG: 3-hydroxyacyl-CoA dehydrogenase NAD-binding domain-containing protein [Nitriliruptoraceae bacterium]